LRANQSLTYLPYGWTPQIGSIWVQLKAPPLLDVSFKKRLGLRRRADGNRELHCHLKSPDGALRTHEKVAAHDGVRTSKRRNQLTTPMPE
jgi:hypothetical protein